MFGIVLRVSVATHGYSNPLWQSRSNTVISLIPHVHTERVQSLRGWARRLTQACGALSSRSRRPRVPLRRPHIPLRRGAGPG